MHLTVGKETVEKLPVKVASGAKFVADGDPTTTFWSKGDRADVNQRALMAMMKNHKQSDAQAKRLRNCAVGFATPASRLAHRPGGLTAKSGKNVELRRTAGLEFLRPLAPLIAIAYQRLYT